MTIYAIFWSLKLCLRSICGAKAAWLPSLCGGKCIAPIHVQSKVCKFAPHMDGSNADFAPHMEGSHSDFALHMGWRHSFRNQMIAQTASPVSYQRELFKTTNILRVYMTYVATFENRNILREVTFKVC